MMAIDAAALVAVLCVATWAGLPRLESGSNGGAGLAYWGPFPGDEASEADAKSGD